VPCGASAQVESITATSKQGVPALGPAAKIYNFFLTPLSPHAR
jgi:hypothetical protein